MSGEDRIYLGDGLYAEDRGYDIRLYATNGMTVHDQVFLDRGMLARLASWAARQ